MNVVERAARLHGALLYDEMSGAFEGRTLEILEMRRKTAIVKRRGWLVRRMLLLADVVGLALAFVATQLLFEGGSAIADRVEARTEFLLFLATLPLWVVVVKIYGLYDRDEERAENSTADDVPGIFHLVTVGSWLVFAGARLAGLANPDVAKVATFWALAIALLALGRTGARALCRRRLAYLQNTVVVGAGDVGQLVARKLLNHREYGINLVGFVDTEPKELGDDLRRVPFLGGCERLPAIVRLFDVERVVIAFSSDSDEVLLELVRSLKDLEVQVDVVPRLFEIVGPGVRIHTVEGLPLIGLPPPRLSRSSRLLKRSLDLALAVPALALLAPVFALIAVVIKLDSHGPVFFRQVRMGAGDQTFRIWKFRTMIADADERKREFVHLNGHARNGGDPRMFKIPDDPRTTRIGAFLRRRSLDELPQLFNVVRGEMSLVGPRPLILDEDAYVEEWARKRLDLRPGMTGLWQVLGRSDIAFDGMVTLDYLYVTNWSLGRDLKILAQTFPAVWGRPPRAC